MGGVCKGAQQDGMQAVQTAAHMCNGCKVLGDCSWYALNENPSSPLSAFSPGVALCARPCRRPWCTSLGMSHRTSRQTFTRCAVQQLLSQHKANRHSSCCFCQEHVQCGQVNMWFSGGRAVLSTCNGSASLNGPDQELCLHAGSIA